MRHRDVAYSNGGKHDDDEDDDAVTHAVARASSNALDRVDAQAYNNGENSSPDPVPMEDSTTLWLRREVEDITREINEQVKFRMRNLVDDFAPLLNSHHRIKALRPRVTLPPRGKQFVPRESKLTDLFQTEEFKTIYNIFVVVLIVLSLQTIHNDVAQSGDILKALDFSLITWAFGQISVTGITWVFMFIQTLCIYPVFEHWAYNVHASYLLYTGFYVLYQLVFFAWPFYVTYTYHLPPASAMVVICEQLRMIMKAHSFVRENAPIIAERKNLADFSESDIRQLGLQFNNYVYFLFAPTLLYRSVYPRTPKIRWQIVVINFAQVIASLFYTYYIFVRVCVPTFRETGIDKDSFRVKAFVNNVFQSMLPGTCVLLLGFFAILHSWLNTFAEMLRFADREFYKDWWNSKNFANYYRTWNVVVHDWLYAYIYVELRNKGLVRKNKYVAMLAVFVVSSVLHEYVVMLGLGFFYPVLLLMFGGAGVFFIFLTQNQTSRFWNVFMWLMLFFGTGMLMCLYSLEWYARKYYCGDNCSMIAWPPYSFRQEWSWE